MINPIEPILAMVILLTVMLGGLQLFGRYLSDYRLGDTAIEFVLFQHIQVWSVPYQDVLSVEPISIGKAFVAPSLHFANRPFAQHVLLKRKRGIFKTVLMTPSHPEEFVATVRQKIQK